MQVVLNTKISLELRQQLDKHTKESGKAIARVVAEALEMYVNKNMKGGNNMTNAQMAKEVVQALREDTDHKYNIDFEEILNTIDISRPDESEEEWVDMDTVIFNFKQSLEVQ